MNKLEIRQNNSTEFFFEGNSRVRTILVNEKVWFVAKDVCEVLGIHSTQTRRLDDDEKMTLRLMQGETKRCSNTIVINESGLYDLVMTSKKIEAKKFRKWVTNEVIPSIQKHGAYIKPEKLYELQTNPEAIDELFNTLSSEQEKNKKLTELIGELKPKAELFDEMHVGIDNTIDIRDVSDYLSIKGMGRNNLMDYLRRKRILTKTVRIYDGDKVYSFNRPSRKYIERGWFDVIPYVVKAPSGKLIQGIKTIVTNKGLVDINNCLIKDGYTKKTKGRFERFSA